MKLLSIIKRSGLTALPLAILFTTPDTLADNNDQLVKQLCTACHSTRNMERSSGYSKAHWQSLISYMVDLSDNKSLVDELTNQLSQTYPINEKRISKVVNGDYQLQFKYWQVPTLGQRARDPVQGKDGVIWWVGQWGNILGRLDPNTGEMKEYMLPKGTYPHSVSLDANLTPWFLGNKNGTVGYLDLETESFKVFNMPDERAKDPHTGVFDKQGIFGLHCNIAI